MEQSIRYAVLFSIGLALPAFAQSLAPPGTVTRGGVVSLGASTSTSTGTITSTVAAAPYGGLTNSAQPATAAATGGSTAGSNSAGGAVGRRSIGPANIGAATPLQATAGGSSGSATGATSSGAPAWLLCPPPGALGMQPFLAGTDLSCAP